MKHMRFRFELYHLGDGIGVGTAEDYLCRFLREKRALPTLVSLYFVGNISQRLSVMMHYEIIETAVPKIRIFYEGPNDEFGSQTPAINEFLASVDLLIDPVDCSTSDGEKTAQAILYVYRDKIAVPAPAA